MRITNYFHYVIQYIHGVCACVCVCVCVCVPSPLDDEGVSSLAGDLSFFSSS